MDFAQVYDILANYAVPFLGVAAVFFGWSSRKKDRLKKEVGEAVEAVRDAWGDTTSVNIKSALDEVVDVGFLAKDLFTAKQAKENAKYKIGKK